MQIHCYRCGKRANLKKCKYCNEYFCEEHLPAKMCLTRAILDDKKIHPSIRTELEKEWRKEGGHPDAEYTSQRWKKFERKEKEYHESVSKFLDASKTEKTIPVVESPSEENFVPLNPIQIRKFRFPRVRIDFGKILPRLFIALLILGFISPTLLFLVHPTMQEMQYVIGTPKPIYLYDIDSSCSNYESNILSSLNHLSEETGVKFVRLQSPLSLLSGGISYSCNSVMTNFGTVGEAESGFIGIGWFVVAWNNIRLSSVSQDVILHETLHVMGFGHSSDSTSIMYPYTNGGGVENSLTTFVTKYYTNPLSYFNVIPLNLLIVLFLLVLFLFPERQKLRCFRKRC